MVILPARNCDRVKLLISGLTKGLVDVLYYVQWTSIATNMNRFGTAIVKIKV